MKRWLALGALAAALALPAAGSAVVERGTITPNRGARGVTLGMTRAQVVALLGKPVYKNQHGYMEYSKQNLFDLYLDVSTSPDRVRLIGISGPRFCFAAGFCMYDEGAVGKLKTAYGSALKVVRLEDGERVYRLRGTFEGCDVFTDFSPERFKSSSRIMMVFIGYLSGGACGG